MKYLLFVSLIVAFAHFMFAQSIENAREEEPVLFRQINKSQYTINSRSDYKIHANENWKLEKKTSLNRLGDISNISSFPFQDSYSSYYESFPITLGNGIILVIWAKLYGDSLFSVKSTNGGISWNNPTFISLTNGSCQSLCGMRTSSGRIIAVWQNSIDGLKICYSDNEGSTWTAPSAISNNPSDSYSALTQTLNGKLWLCYGRYYSGTSYDVFCRTSIDNGLTWSSEQALLSSSSNELYGNIISKDSSTTLFFYRNPTSINYCSSTDNGTTWSSAIPIIIASSLTRPRVLRQTNGTIWLIYQLNKNTSGGFTQGEIFYTKSNDGGLNWASPSNFTNYAGYDGWFNLCLLNNQPFITFASTRWSNYYNLYNLWYGTIGISTDANTPPALISYSNSTPLANSPISIQAIVADESGINNVQLSYSLNDAPIGPIQMYDDGAHNDGSAGDSTYGVTMGPFTIGDLVDYWISITDNNSNTVNIHGALISISMIHDAGNIVLKIGTNSELGDNGITRGISALWPKSNGADYLCDGGLWVCSQTGGQNIVIKQFYGNSDWLRSSGTPITLASGISDQDGNVTFDDRMTPSQIGLQVHQQSYQWSNSSRDDFIIFKYTITNRNINGTLNNLYVGLWTDPDIALQTNPSLNLAGYDNQRNLVYAYNSQDNPSGYFGIELLSPNGIPSTVYSWLSGTLRENGNDFFYQCLTKGDVTISDSIGDVRMLMVSPLFSLAPGSSKDVVFGMVMGNGLTDLQANADTMKHVFENTIPTAVNHEQTENIAPDDYKLYQNYPNPFNPSTNISFDLPSKSFVSLIVFDLIGREVATLVSEELPAGYHSCLWNANGMPSGIYFYRLQTGAFTETKKLVLLR